MSALTGRVRSSSLAGDSDTLALLGKKQVLKRRFGFWSLLAFAVCELITWETVLALFSQGLNNGGPAGLVYGYILGWVSTMSVYAVISELASIAPIASGQYHWVYMMAPIGYKKISSYLIGWLTTLSWIATIATESLFAGTMIQGILILQNPDYDGTLWQGTLLTWAVIVVNIFVNTVIPGALPRLEILVMVLHICGFFAIMITLLLTSEIGSTSSVFLTSLNEGGWPTQGISYCVGFLGSIAIWVGADASVHVSEEVSNAAINIPRAICFGMTINGAIGFAMLITLLFCLGDVKSVLDTKTAFPFIQVFYNSANNLGGAIAMTVVVLVLTWACALGITTTASRMAWSFARDRGMPFSRFISKVDPRTQVPVLAVGVVAALAALLTLIYVGSSTAFTDVISLTVTGFYCTYFLPCALLLYHRVKGNVLPYSPAVEIEVESGDESGTKTETAEKTEPTTEIDDTVEQGTGRLIWGPWHIKGFFGIVNNAYACVYMIFVIFWSVWPPETPVDAANMNYSIVVTGGVLIFSVVWYFWRGRKEYRGPLVDEDVASIVRAGSIVAV